MARTATRPGSKNCRLRLRGEELKKRIVRVLAQNKIALEWDDLWDTDKRLREGMGIDLGAFGAPLLQAVVQLMDEGKLVAYRRTWDKELCFVPASMWRKWTEKDPSLENERVFSIFDYYEE